MSREKRTLVTSFETLKAGDLIEWERCIWCAGTHRAMLIRRGSDGWAVPGGGSRNGRTWTLAPAVSHRSGRSVVLSEGAVSERRVYLIDTGLESSQETHSRAKKPRSVRA